MDLYITSGSLSLPKKLFIREMLQPNSPLKSLLNYELEDTDKKRIVHVDKTRDADRVIIDFTEGSSVKVGEDYQKLLSALKEKYTDQVKGRIIMSGDEWYESMQMTLDLDGPDGKIRMLQ